jgi:hypothetical protein
VRCFLIRDRFAHRVVGAGRAEEEQGRGAGNRGQHRAHQEDEVQAGGIGGPQGVDGTSWVTVLSGGTEITCITRTRAQSENGELLLQKLPRTPRITDVTAHCVLRSVAGVNGWPGRTAALGPAEVAALRPEWSGTTPPTAPVALGPTDHDLLAALARDGRAGIPDLAAATRSAETTVRRRLDDLRRTGVLYFDVDTEPRLFGYQATGVGSLHGVSAAEAAPVVGRVKSAGALLTNGHGRPAGFRVRGGRQDV